MAEFVHDGMILPIEPRSDAGFSAATRYRYAGAEY
jgi:hypothetical protein